MNVALGYGSTSLNGADLPFDFDSPPSWAGPP